MIGNGINHLLQAISRTFRYPGPMRLDATYFRLFPVNPALNTRYRGGRVGLDGSRSMLHRVLFFNIYLEGNGGYKVAKRSFEQYGYSLSRISLKSE